MSDPNEPGSVGTPNAAQLRGQIDQGKTGDKVPALDPAAAPLGTDDEAAGTPVTPDRAALSMATSGPPVSPTAPQHVHEDQPGEAKPEIAMLVVGVLALIGVGILIAAILAMR